MHTKTQLSFENTENAFQHRDNMNLKRAYYLFKMVKNPGMVKFGKNAIHFALSLKIPVKPFVKPVFNHFCGGETIEKCKETILELGKYNVGTILDYSVEGKSNEQDFERTLKETLQNIEKAANSQHIPYAVFKVTGVGAFKLLEKASGGSDFSGAEKEKYAKLVKRVETICAKAHELKVALLIDAEESWIQNAIDRLAETMMARFNKEQAIVFNTVQLYRHDRYAYLESLAEKARQAGFKVGVKLVRGAYMEKERDRAKKMGYPSPIQPNKEATDKDFDKALDFCLRNIDLISVCAGTHNEKSSLYLAQKMDELGIDHHDKRIFFSQLYGMSDHISFNLAKHGYNTAKYVPYGPVNDVIPYLIRRAEENTSVEGQTGRELSLLQKEMQRRKK